MEFKVGERGIGSTFGKEELDAVAQALKGNTLTYGPMRDKFEREFAEYVGVKYALAVSSCTAALDIATQIVAPNDGDEIICSSQTFKATVIGGARTKAFHPFRRCQSGDAQRGP